MPEHQRRLDDVAADPAVLVVVHVGPADPDGGHLAPARRAGPGTGSGRSSTTRSPAPRSTLTRIAVDRPLRAAVRQGRGHFTAPRERPWTSLSWAANPAIEHRQRDDDGGRAHLGQEQALAGDEAGQEDRRGRGDRSR